MCGETTPFTIFFGLLSALLGAALIFSMVVMHKVHREVNTLNSRLLHMSNKVVQSNQIPQGDSVTLCFDSLYRYTCTFTGQVASVPTACDATEALQTSSVDLLGRSCLVCQNSIFYYLSGVDSDHQEDTSPTQDEEQYEVITTYGGESSIQTESGRMILMSENESYALSKQWSHH